MSLQQEHAALRQQLVANDTEKELQEEDLYVASVFLSGIWIQLTVRRV
jgi:hypothetical protein